MRGKEYCCYICRGLCGITPAYAGKSKAARNDDWTVRDHPRICGEKKQEAPAATVPEGSPPHMRGKGRKVFFLVACKRITPAYAGKRWNEERITGAFKDHPRICGEKQHLPAIHRRQEGSPPHMRGKACVLFCCVGGIGITPAYAGKRLKRSRSTVPPVAIVPLFPSVCNKPVVSDGSPAGRDAPLFLPAENAVPASPAYNLRSL